MKTYEEAREVVGRGAALLDAAHPGWAAKIDLGTLDLANGCHCILGQLYGSYNAGLHALAGWCGFYPAPTPRGFDLSFEALFSQYTPRVQYGWLERAWTEALLVRTTYKIGWDLAAPETPVEDHELVPV